MWLPKIEILISNLLAWVWHRDNSSCWSFLVWASKRHKEAMEPCSLLEVCPLLPVPNMIFIHKSHFFPQKSSPKLSSFPSVAPLDSGEWHLVISTQKLLQKGVIKIQMSWAYWGRNSRLHAHLHTGPPLQSPRAGSGFVFVNGLRRLRSASHGPHSSRSSLVMCEAE